MGSPIQIGPLSTDRRSEWHAPRITKQDSAAWLVGGKGFFDQYDILHTPGVMLYYDLEPNFDLIPLNKKAYDNQQMFLDKIDHHTQIKAKKDGKAFTPIERKPWKDEFQPEDLPSVDAVMAFKKTGSNQQIR